MLHTISRVVGDQVVFDCVDVHISYAGSSEFSSQLCAKRMQLDVEKFCSTVVLCYTVKLIQLGWVFAKQGYVLR
jgi:hypothetical protein